MELENNPFIKPENYFEGYNKSIDELKNNPLAIKFDKLCYDVFEHYEPGRKWLELVKERYVLPSLVSKGNPTYQIDVLWQEGFKDFARMIMACVMSHSQRIQAGAK